MERKLDLNRNWDFSEIFGYTTVFIRENLKRLLGITVALIAPAYALAVLVQSYLIYRNVTATMLDRFSTGGTDDSFRIIIVIAFYFLSFIMAFGAIFTYMQLYNDTREPITTGRVWKALARKLPRLLIFNLLYLVISLVVVFLASLLIGLISNASEIIGGIVLVIFMLGGMSFFSVLLPVLVFEDEGVFESISRAATIMQDRFWRTVAVNFITLFIITSVIGVLFLLLFTLPMFFYREFTNAISHKGLIIYRLVVTGIIALAGFLFYVYYYVVLGFQYYGLLEKTNYAGLKKRIENIGNTGAAIEEQY